MTRAFRIAGYLTMILLAGCGGGSVPSATPVSGTVLMDGQPLEEGEIFFEEDDKSQSPSSAKITKGIYTAQVPAGNKKVRITASRPGKPDPLMGVGPPEPIIGPEFNIKSTLKHKVEATPQTGVDFEVKALPVK